jgi:cytochrome c553
MKKSILVIAILISMIALSFTFIPTEGPKYKNLKILKKDISKNELDSVMHFFSMSLGQKCGFCHVRNEQEKKWDFASDDVPFKNVARKMMLMSNKINKQYFKNEEDKKAETIQAVTCYSCHHGEAIPQIKPPMPVRDTAKIRILEKTKTDSIKN